jgi:uncharacterized protein (DUF39 family)
MVRTHYKSMAAGYMGGVSVHDAGREIYRVWSHIIRPCVYDAEQDAQRIAQAMDPSIRFNADGSRA